MLDARGHDGGKSHCTIHALTRPRQRTYTERAKTSDGRSFFVDLLLVVRLAVTRNVQELALYIGFCLRVETDQAARGHAQLTDNTVAMIRSITFSRVAPSKAKNVPTGSSV